LKPPVSARRKEQLHGLLFQVELAVRLAGLAKSNRHAPSTRAPCGPLESRLIREGDAANDEAGIIGQSMIESDIEEFYRHDRQTSRRAAGGGK
jgi:hypothetical protein